MVLVFGSGGKSVLTTEQCSKFSTGIFLRGLFTTLCRVTVQLYRGFVISVLFEQSLFSEKMPQSKEKWVKEKEI